jgi:hypothetical protein
MFYVLLLVLTAIVFLLPADIASTVAVALTVYVTISGIFHFMSRGRNVRSQ